MSTPFRPIEIPPGVVAKPTKQMNSTAWSEVNLMRWVEGQLSPVGGQSSYSYTFASRCRRIHGWYDLNRIYRIAYLCEQHLYVDQGGVLTDISPNAALASVAYNTGNYNVGVYSGTAGSGIAPPSFGVGGYGDDIYNLGTYGTPRAETDNVQIDQIPSAFSLDNFGAILYAMTSPDGRLLKWDPAVGGVAIEQAADSGRGPVPRGRCFVVTNERFIMVFGAVDATNGGGPNRFAWCDQENPGAWDYTNVISMAGYLDIEPSSPIICAVTTRTGPLFWTGKKAYASRFLGMPYIYNYSELTDGTVPWSPQSVVMTSSMVIWMSEQGMFSYDGTSILPVKCAVRSWIDDLIRIPLTHVAVREQSCMVHVANFNEVWWFFPEDGQPHNTRAAIYSFRDGWWSQGKMARSAGITSSYTAHTIMADGLVAYQHEASNVYWAETFDLNLTSGARLITVKQLIPDVLGDVANLRYSLAYKMSRSVMADLNGEPIPVQEKWTPPRPVNTRNGYVDMRTTGRDIRLKIELAGPLVKPVTVGSHLIDVVVRGDR
jgi:hypothetical protein